MSEIRIQGESTTTPHDVSGFKRITVIVHANGGDVGLEHSTDGSNWAESSAVTGTGVITFSGPMQLIRVVPTTTGAWDILGDNK